MSGVGSVTASSALLSNSGVPSNPLVILDESLTTTFQSDPNVAGPSWIQIDLGEIRAIRSISIMETPQYQYVNNLTIYVGNQLISDRINDVSVLNGSNTVCGEYEGPFLDNSTSTTIDCSTNNPYVLSLLSDHKSFL